MEKKYHILFVDDERDLSELYETYFTSQGMDITLAFSGNEAIDLIKKSPQTFDLVLTDYQMPNGNGGAVIQFINGLTSPRPKALLLSGHSLATIKENIDVAEVQLLRKPISLSHLFHAVTEALKNNG